MAIDTLEILVEEASMEAFLNKALPSLLPENTVFSIYTHNGKKDLLRKLPDRLRGYSKWIPDNYGIVVVADMDSDDCQVLKTMMEECFINAGLGTKYQPIDDWFCGLTRVAIEELEAWYFGNWDAVRRAYPRLPRTVPSQRAYRNSDEITGGTWEAFERICKRSNVFTGGLRKVEAARAIGAEIVRAENKSPSFGVFCSGLRALLEQ